MWWWGRDGEDAVTQGTSMHGMDGMGTTKNIDGRDGNDLIAISAVLHADNFSFSVYGYIKAPPHHIIPDGA